jgi:hypothetical protein
MCLRIRLQARYSCGPVANLFKIFLAQATHCEWIVICKIILHIEFLVLCTLLNCCLLGCDVWWRISTCPCCREPEKYGASSCLRQLLDTGDASLGPWVPGRWLFITSCCYRYASLMPALSSCCVLYILQLSWRRVIWEVSSQFCRDFFEDELRAFEGAADGLFPCVWDSEVPAFAQVGGHFQE